jgi:hypothetical protein
MTAPPPSFTCPVCGATSYHPDDIAQGYCGRCHDYTRGPAVVIPDSHTTRCLACDAQLVPADPPPGFEGDGDLDWYGIHPEPVQRGHTRWIAIGRPR